MIIFGVDISLSPHIDNNIKCILILGKGPIWELSEYSLTAEKCIQLILLEKIQNFI